MRNQKAPQHPHRTTAETSRANIQQYTSEDAFAEAIEKVEFENWETVAKVMQEVGETPTRVYESFDDYLEAQKDTGHTQHYKKEYRENIGIPKTLLRPLRPLRCVSHPWYPNNSDPQRLLLSFRYHRLADRNQACAWRTLY